MLNKINKIKFICLLLLFGLIFEFFVNAQGANPITITVNLSNAPSNISVSKAPLKYNKNFAYSYVFDDGYGEGYDVGFKYLNGGKIDYNNTIYPGVYYTDGAGNDIPFAGGFATTSLSSAGNDLHDGTTPGYISYSQFDETYLAGWNVLHHGFGPILGIPPNYLQDILSGTAYFQSKTTNNIKLQHFVIPDGLNDYAASVFSGGLKSVSQQNTNFFFDGQNNNVSSNGIPVNNLNVNKYAMYRKYFYDSAFTTGTIINDVDEIANLSSGTNKLRRHSFSHRVTFGDNLNGNLSWTKWKYLIDHIADNYGKNGNDSVWFAGPQDVYEYIGTRNAVSIQTGLNGSQFTITLNTNNVDPEYVRKSLSLLLNVQGASINSISYNGDTYHSHNLQNGLINLEWGLVYTGNLNTKVENYVSEAEYYKTQYYIDVAQTWIDFLETGTNKTNFQNRLNNIVIEGTTRQMNLGKTTNSRGSWNNYKEYNTVPGTLNDLYDKYGNSTNLDISLHSGFNNKYAGQTAYPDGSGIYPNSVMDSGLGIYGNALANGTGTIKISGLDISKRYNLTLFGSTNNTQTNNRTVTIYNIGGETKELNIRQNTQNTVIFSGVSTNANGEIFINVAQKDKNRGYGMINAIVIQENFEEGIIIPTASIQYSTTQTTSNNVIATLTGFNKTGITITNNNGSPNYTFTGNGSFTFTFQDNQGVSGSQTATVNWINKALMISGVYPSNNSTNIDIDQDIIIEFKESMNKSSVENNLEISPNPGNQRYQWIANKLYIMHDEFDNNTQYTITLGANTMNSNGSLLGTNYGFSFTTVAASSNQTWQLDFGYDAFSRGSWNQINIGLINGSSNTDLYNSNGNTTNIYIKAIRRGQDKIVTGTITNNDSGIYPDNRIFKGVNTYGKYSTSQGYHEAEMMIGGLDSNKTYNLKFYGNTNRVEADPTLTTTVYNVNGQSVSLQCSQNTSNNVSINNISPSNSGTINFSYKSANETTWTRSYLNVLVIEENGEVVDYIPIPNSERSNTIESEFLNGGYTKGNGAMKSVNPNTLVGKKRISFANNLGRLLVPTVLKSTNDLIEVQFPEGSILKKGESAFEGILNKPIFKDTSNISNLDNVISAITIGDGTNGTISIKDEYGGNLEAIIRIPAPGGNAGEKVNIYYSEDNGSTWDTHKEDNIEIIGGEPYVEFTTDHFTDFAVTLPPEQGGGEFTGSFVINNDSASTTSQSVTLNISTTPAADQMRFSNDGSNRSSWIAYNTSYPRTLSAGTEIKTVYAEFDADGDNIADAQTNDNISYVIGGVGCAGGPGVACVDLEITGTGGSCIIGTDLNLGTGQYSTSAFDFNGDFKTLSGNNNWICSDTLGSIPAWNLSVVSSVLTGTTNGGTTIPATNVYMHVNGGVAQSNQSLSFTFGAGDLISEATVATTKKVFEKTSGIGTVGTLTANDIKLRVHIDAAQDIDTYQGIITIGVPTLQ